MEVAEECHFEVTLYNSGQEYGITLSGGSDHVTPLYIAKVKAGTPAHRCGLQKRDIILSINRFNCINCKHNTAVNLIKSNPKLVTFVIYRSMRPVYTMSSLFEEMKAYVECRKLKLGQPTVDDTSSVEDYKLVSEKRHTSPSDHHSVDHEIISFSTNQSNSNNTNVCGGKLGEQFSSKQSLTSFGSEWYKNYANNTVNAKQNVTVKDIMKLERSKSIQGRPYVKTSTNYSNSIDRNNKNKVKSIVQQFNNQPQYITNNITRSPSKSLNETSPNRETHFNGVESTVVETTENFLDNPTKFLLLNDRFPFPRSSFYEAVACDDYTGNGPCEISVAKGTKLVILRSIDSNWYEGFVCYPDFKIIPKQVVAIGRIVFVNGNGINVEIKTPSLSQQQQQQQRTQLSTS